MLEVRLAVWIVALRQSTHLRNHIPLEDAVQTTQFLHRLGMIVHADVPQRVLLRVDHE